MADPPNALINEAESPGTRDGPGLSCFLAPSSARLKSIFRTLLTPDEQERLVDLLCGPRRSLALDRRLLALGLAYKALGKVVASHAARRVALRERFEIRRGSDARHLATAAMVETDTHEEALSIAWSIAKRDVGSRWHSRLMFKSAETSWTIFLPPPRSWPDCSIRPYILCMLKLQS